MKARRPIKCNFQPLPTQAGFSLIELLAALVLAGLLMMTTAQLLNILRQQESLIARTAQSDSAWVSRTLDLLEYDLQNSRTVRPIASGFELSGFAGTDPATGAATQSEVFVRWAVEDLLGQFWLVRTESNPTTLSNRPDRRRIVAVDVNQVSLWFTDAPNVRFFPDDSTGQPYSPLPASIICQLSLRRAAEIVYRRRTVLLRP